MLTAQLKGTVKVPSAGLKKLLGATDRRKIILVSQSSLVAAADSAGSFLSTSGSIADDHGLDTT